ncbi:MAG: B12-binding domain-containing protein, partial [Spirochaetes bacterium]|nr:B12-binding domain-containing protein [Spirochaetota bacterium]
MFDELPESIIRGDEEEAKRLTQKYLDDRKEPEDILKNGLIAGMDVVGQRFKVYEM